MEREVWRGKGPPAARPAGTGVAGGDGEDCPVKGRGSPVELLECLRSERCNGLRFLNSHAAGELKREQKNKSQSQI